jgi:hypothetical protein
VIVVFVILVCKFYSQKPSESLNLLFVEEVFEIKQRIERKGLSLTFDLSNIWEVLCNLIRESAANLMKAVSMFCKYVALSHNAAHFLHICLCDVNTAESDK